MYLSDMQGMIAFIMQLKDKGACHLIDDLFERLEDDKENYTPQWEFLQNFIDAHIDELTQLGLIL